MNEPDELFADPRKIFDDGARAKELHRQRLGSIFAPPEPEATDDEAALVELADVVADRVVERLAGEPEPEQAAEAGAVGRGFDGGARRNLPQPPEAHGLWLSRVLRERWADRGADF
jgi:hypothetical protein